MKLYSLPLLVAGASFASAAPITILISTTEVSSFRLGHAATHARPSEMRTAQSEAGLRPPTRIRHLCSGMKDGVSRMLGAMGLAGHFNPPPITSPVPHHSGAPLHSPVRFDQDKAHEHHHSDEQDKEEGHGHGIMVKFRPGPPMRPAEEGEMEEHHGHRIHHHHHAGAMHHWKHHKGAFLQRIHRALMSLGPWEGRAMAFVLGCGIGVLLRMFWVLAVLIIRTVRGTNDTASADNLVFHEVIFTDAEDIVVPPPNYTLDEKTPLYPIEEKPQVEEETVERST